MAFRKKADFILKLKPDILIVPECEHPEKLNFQFDTPKPKDTLWFGTNQNKGLAIFSYSDYRFKLSGNYNPKLRLIIPIEVTGGQFDFTLFAIWAYNPQDREYNYIGQVWKALNYYKDTLNCKNIILAGDFNSNVIWDKLNRKSSHSMVVEKLKNLNISSCYHSHRNQVQGKEKHPTYYMYRHKNKPYHIDYCFVSETLAENIKSVEIGDYDIWIKYSDHVPVSVTFNNKKRRRANA